MKKEDVFFMRRALELAKKGMGQVHPNPMVGALLVKNGKILAQGAHLKFGGPHAEAHALKGKVPLGSTLYVTLEPCAYTGKTPPCLNSILQKKISRVVIGAQDVNPRVSGKGIRALKRAGISVTTGVLEKESLELNRDFNHWIRRKTPYVVVKAAQTLDGKIAASGGDSKWITGKEARAFAHRLRAESDAVLVGIGTALKDDPKLTVRLPGIKANPFKVVLDSRLRLSPKAKLFGRTARVLIAVSTKVPAARFKRFGSRAQIIRIKEKRAGELDWHALLKELGGRGITRLFIEGGGTVIGSAFRERIVNEVYFFVAPKIMGGRGAVSSVAGGALGSLKNIVKLKQTEILQVGRDWLIHGFV